MRKHTGLAGGLPQKERGQAPHQEARLSDRAAGTGSGAWRRARELVPAIDASSAREASPCSGRTGSMGNGTRSMTANSGTAVRTTMRPAMWPRYMLAIRPRRGRGRRGRAARGRGGHGARAARLRRRAPGRLQGAAQGGWWCRRSPRARRGSSSASAWPSSWGSPSDSSSFRSGARPGCSRWSFRLDPADAAPLARAAGPRDAPSAGMKEGRAAWPPGPWPGCEPSTGRSWRSSSPRAGKRARPAGGGARRSRAWPPPRGRCPPGWSTRPASRRATPPAR
jgi:hypothetical protein